MSSYLMILKNKYKILSCKPLSPYAQKIKGSHNKVQYDITVMTNEKSVLL